MQLRMIILMVGVALALSACAQPSRFLPLVDAGRAAREAAAQTALATQFNGGLPERLRQMQNGEVLTDADRGARVKPVVYRLFEAAVPFCPAADCRLPVVLDDGQGLNAHADSRRIRISRAMIDLAVDDSQLALVLGHELAHVVLGHTRRDLLERLNSAFHDGIERDDERHADYVGLYLVARAGYDVRRAVTLWRRMGAVQPHIIAGSDTHPGTAERYVALRQIVAEIEAKRRAGKPLLPN